MKEVIENAAMKNRHLNPQMRIKNNAFRIKEKKSKI